MLEILEIFKMLESWLDLESNIAPVAQLDRVSGYEPEGRRFESSRAHHITEKPVTATVAGFFMSAEYALRITGVFFLL